MYYLSNKWDGFRVKCQRFKRGYSWGDTRNISDWFVNTAKPILEQYLKTHKGVPIGLDEEEWNAIIREMISCLNLMDENEADKHSGVVDGDYRVMQSVEPNKLKMIDKLVEANKNKFFELFSKWFFYLWD